MKKVLIVIFIFMMTMISLNSEVFAGPVTCFNGVHTGAALESSRTDATCTSDGIIYYKCAACGESCGSSVHTKAYGHSYAFVSYASPKPTCIHQGKANVKCSSCGHETTTWYPANQELHEETTSTKAATCTTAGV